MMHLPNIAVMHRDYLKWDPKRVSLQITDVVIPSFDDPYTNSTVYGAALSKYLAYGDLHAAYLPQANADSYAEYVVAEWAHREAGLYPYRPNAQQPWSYTRVLRGAREVLRWNGTDEELAQETCLKTQGAVGLYDTDQEKLVLELPACEELLRKQGVEPEYKIGDNFLPDYISESRGGGL
ncbi:hypothetical protein ABW19_dt0210598 [Dactylella cylindrospora]|nr:hypothetical protein ABW19_dt0210598 [Dactylella cylindrospora]